MVKTDIAHLAVDNRSKLQFSKLAMILVIAHSDNKESYMDEMLPQVAVHVRMDGWLYRE